MKSEPEKLAEALTIIQRHELAASKSLPAPAGSEIREVVYMCNDCKAIYTEKISQCDCVVGKRFDYTEGVAIFYFQNTKIAHSEQTTND